MNENILKIVINRATSYFCLSSAAISRYLELEETRAPLASQEDFPISTFLEKEWKDGSRNGQEFEESLNNFICWEDRTRLDPLLIQTVEELGKEAQTQGSKLKIFKIHRDLIDYFEIIRAAALEDISFDFETYFQDQNLKERTEQEKACILDTIAIYYLPDHV